MHAFRGALSLVSLVFGEVFFVGGSASLASNPGSPRECTWGEPGFEASASLHECFLHFLVSAFSMLYIAVCNNAL